MEELENIKKIDKILTLILLSIQNFTMKLHLEIEYSYILVGWQLVLYLKININNKYF